MAVSNESKKNETKKRNTKPDLSVGEIIDMLKESEWNILTDLYFCRCMPQSAMIRLYFTEELPEEGRGGENFQISLEETDKMFQKATRAHKYIMYKLKNWGLIENSNFNSYAASKLSNVKDREMWYYLSSRGLKIIESKREILEENRLSKNDLDMGRAKKNHFWELAKVYLDLRYEIISQMDNMIQFIDWDWYPSYSIYSDQETYTIRPDAILRIGEQLFFIELDRSTEPVQRSPLHSDQVSIEKKIGRYKDIIKLSSNSTIKKGIIAFIVPGAKKNTRLENIASAAERVFGKEHRVFTGRNIREIITASSETI